MYLNQSNNKFANELTRVTGLTGDISATMDPYQQ